MDTDVLSEGFGPTGLMLACWLTRLGIHPLVIEQKKGLTRESRALIVLTNLGWKLAAVLKGEADERLLASYESERMAVARQLEGTTDRAFSVVVGSSVNGYISIMKST